MLNILQEHQRLEKFTRFFLKGIEGDFDEGDIGQ